MLGLIVKEATLTSISWFPDSCILAVGETVPWNGLWFKAWAASYKTEVCISGCYLSTCAIAGSSVGHAIFNQDSCFWAMGYMLWPVNSVLLFLCHGISSWIRHNAVGILWWMVAKATQESIDGGAGRSITGREGQSASRVCTPSVTKDRNGIKMPLGGCLVCQGVVLHRGPPVAFCS